MNHLQPPTSDLAHIQALLAFSRWYEAKYAAREVRLPFHWGLLVAFTSVAFTSVAFASVGACSLVRAAALMPFISAIAAVPRCSPRHHSQLQRAF